MLSFFPVMTKTLKFFTALIALTLATPAFAQEVTGWYTPRLAFIRASIGETVYPCSQPLTYSVDGETMLQGEEVAALYVVLKSGVTLSATDDPPFDVAVDGTIIPDTDKVARLVWPAVGNVESDVHGSYLDAPTSLTNAGFPVGQWTNDRQISSVLFSYIGLDCYWPKNEKALEAGQTLALYFIVFDTRVYAPETGNVSVTVSTAQGEKGPARVSAWNAELCATLAAVPYEGSVPEFYFLNIPDQSAGEETSLGLQMFQVVEAYKNRPKLTPLYPTRVPTLPATLTVNGEALTDVAAIEEALSPAVSGLVVAKDGSGLTLTLAPPDASGLMAYDLWTTDKLDGTWVRFDEFLTQKGLATSDGMRYTKLRIDREESLQIRQLKGEPTRFYQLRAAGSETGEQK